MRSLAVSGFPVLYPRIVPNFQNCARCEKDMKNISPQSKLKLRRKLSMLSKIGFPNIVTENVFSIGVYYGTSVLTLCFSISPSCALLLRNTCQVCMISVPHGSKVS